MTYKTIHTKYGLTAMAKAEATGTPINLTQMAVGDGNGNAVEPTEAQTSLVRELYRAAPNGVRQDPNTPNKFTAELVIPASVGGFVLREIGAFDANGSLFVVGNLPETYKPQTSDGAYADTVVRIDFMVTNASVVVIQVDPNVAVATQQWISNNVTAAFLLPGGTTHQVLRKKSNADGDTEWASPTDVNVTVDMIEEPQTLAAGQTAVILTTTTTNGLSIYIEGVRLRAGQWTKVDATHLTLASSYPDGTKLVAVQNEPAGSMVDPLEKQQNLDDVPDKSAARANLDVHSRAESNASGQPGDIKYTARNTAPAGWMKANGAAVSRTAYADLFAAIGTRFGIGDGFNTFNLPDLRGEFIRGWDDGRGVDSGRTIGSSQADAYRAHTHGGVPKYLPAGDTDRGSSSSLFSVDDASETASSGGSETRPRNLAMLACIKY